VRDRVHKGEVGHVHTIKTVSRDSPLPTIEYLKVSGGIFHDCLVHDIDMITWVLGEYPDKVRFYIHIYVAILYICVQLISWEKRIFIINSSKN